MKTAKIDLAASGEVVAAVTGKRLRVISASYSSSATLTSKWRGGTTDLEGARTMVAGVPVTLPSAPGIPGERSGYFESASGENLNLVLAGAGQVSGFLTYVEVDP